MIMYIEYENGTRIKNISSIVTDRCNIEVIFDEPIDVNKLRGYVTYLNYQEGKVHANFDPQTWADYQEEVARTEAINMAQKMVKEISYTSVLDNATEEQAFVMKPLYPQWDGNGVEYKEGQYVQYEGDLYRVNKGQSHTSQPTWNPKDAPSLWSKVGDPSVEYPEFIQPTGAHNAYSKGDKVTFKGKHYISKVDNNVYSPEDYPSNWELVEDVAE